MRKREEQAIEKSELKEKAFQKIKDLVHCHVFSDPELLRDLSIALRYGSRNQEQQDALFEDMVQNNAEFCLKPAAPCVSVISNPDGQSKKTENSG